MLEQKIKQSFDLFTGKRSASEDMEIYEKVNALCFDEICRFLEENLSPKKARALGKSFKEVGSSDPDEAIAALVNAVAVHAEDINDFKFRLGVRLDAYISSLLVSSINKHNGNKQ